MRGTVCLVTGATGGIGYETALGLARLGARVAIVGRDPGKLQACADRIRAAVPGAAVEPHRADLSAQAEIRRLAGALRSAYPRLDVLVNNAGAIFDRRTLTVDGIERTWALDHLGYVLLTLELLDTLKESAATGGKPRIVNVASAAHYRGHIDFDDVEGARRYRAMGAYAQAKLGNVLFTYALARRLRGSGITVNAVHPGVVNTGFAKNTGGLLGAAWALMRPFLITPEKGARTSLRVASDPGLDGVTGRYFSHGRPKVSSAESRDEAVQERLWALSLRQVGRSD
ncbi:retinol dehydrogenase-12 [Methylobacterium sp. PvP062]|uniref:NAD(P)-dependent dehydrogenase (Short-subunit alcohol dehydrogenase family) n=1 Tax=Methylobacterium radiotolerans TaxID=31998 RepID=A0ABV2NJH7_9HYPH|nr:MULTISPECIES: SDR family oxidoreductase [unclassified Methylobacterium]MBP2496749.1 NAD(P)-dependent dehydrogenase (short-subunit alcohol dehydrogenase family) [Methylobacterium sp. PvP105]MBP2503380.1 NAD(P)-dependent dehydrogenase (short-subunit alcohol dehydrogenase family) [Methylobacterium sp. PvP109]MCX4196784.1 SDR family oxidoreductase [Methylobacterium organophilum]MCX7334847.1 SDR family oxidoreductase [Hyphomicrobiales bacterium]